MDPTTPSAVSTQESLLTLQDSAAAVLLVPAVLGNLIGPRSQLYAKWVPFATAIVPAYMVAALGGDDAWALKRLLAFLNAFLVLAIAVGFY